MIQPLFLGLGTTEIIVILVVVLLLFGGKKIPELMRGAGKGVRAFKDGMKEPTTEDEASKEDKAQEPEA
ncbi:MAG: twin-arginine translocase TatA/TatE family subunit [Bacteroidaceae bacterium]|nr:twin-arginine translocase TatA/TatE family subunit [Bacteroidaceae bacterium]